MFHVHEKERIVAGTRLASTYMDGKNGAFLLQSPEPGWQLQVIAADGSGPDGIGELGHWEHVSVCARMASGKGRVRIPSWREMCFVKDHFWDKDDVVVQFHPRESEYVNTHPAVLHLWRWKHGTFPTPPIMAV